MELEQIQQVPDPRGLPEPAGLDSPDESHPDGPLGKLRVQRARLAEHRTREFEIPGYNGFYVRVHRIGVEQSRKVLNDPDATAVERNAQLLIDMTEELFLREDGQDTHVAYGFDDELADGLEIRVDHQADMGPARQVVLGVFDGNEHALALFGVVIYSWMVSAQSEEDEKALGGSTGTPTSR